MYDKVILLLLLLTVGTRLTAQVHNVKSFGARGNGKTDDTYAIQAAIDKAATTGKGVVYFPKGTYLIGSYVKTKNYLENYCLVLRNNIVFKGEGKTSIVKVASHLFDKKDTGANAHLFYGKVVHSIEFDKLLIDMNGAKNLAPESIRKNGTAIFIKNSWDISIKNITVKNCAGRNMVLALGKGYNLRIEKSSFINGGYYVGTSTANKFQDDFSFLYSEWDSTSIINNIIQQQNLEIALSNYTGGIELHGSYSTASKNKITGCFPGLYISSSWNAMQKILIEKNKFLSCIKGVILFVIQPMNNITIQNNEIQLTATRRITLGVQPGIEVPNGNSITYSPQLANNAPLYNITIANNIITSLVAENSSIKTAGMVLHSLQSSRVSNNTIKGMNYGGIVLQGSKWGIDSLTIKKNTVSGFRYNIDDKAVCGYIVITDTYSGREKNAPGFKNLYITKNNFIENLSAAKRTDSIALKRKFAGAYVAVPGPTASQIHFDDNNFSNKKEGVKLVKMN